MGVEHLSAVATAIAGRTMQVAAGSAPAHVDGAVIKVPPDQEAATAVIAQAGLVTMGSLQRQLVAPLAARPRLLRRYLTLEIARAAAQTPVPAWYEDRVRQIWPGEPSESVGESARRARSNEQIPELPAEFGTIRMATLSRAPQMPSANPKEGTIRNHKRIEQRSGEDDVTADATPKKKSRWSLMNALTGMSNPLMQALRDLLREGRAASSGTDGGDELPTSGIRRVDSICTNASVVASIQGVASEGAGQAASNADAWLPEWDQRVRKYKLQHCRVVRYDVNPDAEPGVSRTVEPRLRAALARLRRGHERHRRQADGDDIDVDGIVDFAIGRRTGIVTGDVAPYSALRRTARTMGIVVLLDASGSSSEGRHGARSVWEQQQATAATLIAGLEEVGDRVGAYAFRSHGRKDVRFLRIKGFDQRFDAAALGRLSAIEPSGFTRLGAAIRYGTHLAEHEAATPHKLLIVVSDGFPYETDYESTYAAEDTKRALEEAAARGVGPVCISVSRRPDDGPLVERIWGKVGHANLASRSALADVIEPLLDVAARRAATANRLIGATI